MICKKCNNEINDDSLFCSKCGYKMNNKDSFSNYFERKKTYFLIICLAIIALGGGATFIYNKPINVWSRLMKAEDYKAATDHYLKNSDTLNTNEIDKVNDLIFKTTDDIFSKYVRKEMEYEVAINYFNQMLPVTTSAEKIEGLIDRVNAINESRTAFATAEKFFESGKYEDAISYYEKVVMEDDVNYSIASERILECQNLYRETILEIASQKEETGEYARALEAVDAGLKFLPSDSELVSYSIILRDKLGEQETELFISELQEIISKGDLTKAIKKVQSYNGDDNDQVREIKARVEDEYTAEIIDEVTALLAESNVDGAKKLLQDANRYVPDSEDIEKWMEDIDSYYPISLLDLDVFLTENSDGNLYLHEWISGKDSDNLGNSEYSGIKYQVSYKKTAWETCTYIIDGKYNVFEGIFALHQNSKDRTRDIDWATLTIIGDGVTLYTSPQIKGGVKPISFSVDISNVNELQYRIDAQGGMCFGILKPELCKRYCQ